MSRARKQFGMQHQGIMQQLSHFIGCEIVQLYGSMLECLIQLDCSCFQENSTPCSRITSLCYRDSRVHSTTAPSHCGTSVFPRKESHRSAFALIVSRLLVREPAMSDVVPFEEAHCWNAWVRAEEACLVTGSIRLRMQDRSVRW